MSSASASYALAFTIERAALLKALAGALGSVESRQTIPVLSHFLIVAEAGGVVVTGTNLDLQVTASAPAEVERPGAVTVAAQAFYDVVRKAKDGVPISIEGDPVKVSTVIKSGRSRFALPGFPVSDYPEFGELQRQGESGFAHRFTIAGSILASMIGRCQFAISTEETRYYLNGIYTHCVEVEGGPVLRFVATTGLTLARIDTTRASGIALDMPAVILPRKAVELIKKLAESTPGEDVEVSISPRLVRARVGVVSIVSKLIEGTFPDYARVIPTAFSRECVAPTLALIEAVGRVGLVGTEKVRAIKLSFDEDRITVGLRNTEGGEATDEVDAELTGDPIEIGFNGKFLSDVLGQTGGDTVRIKLGDTPTSPAVLGDKLAEGLFVVMPLRI